MSLSLNQDNGGDPGAAIQTWTLTGLPSFPDTSAFDAALGSGETLTGGDQYWLVATPVASDSYDVWNFNTIGDTGPVELSADGLTWVDPHGQPPFTRSAFDVIVTTPEPGSLLLVGMGLLGFWVRRAASGSASPPNRASVDRQSRIGSA